MPVDINDVMQLLATLSKEENLKVTIKESVRGGVIAGVTTALGGVVAGPPGLAIGGALGGGLAYYLSRGKFKPAAEVIMEMDEAEKQILYKDAMRVLNRLEYTDLITLMTVVQGDPMIYRELLSTIITFFNTNLKMEILD